MHSGGALLTSERFNQIHRGYPNCSGRALLLLSVRLATYAPHALRRVPFVLVPAKEDCLSSAKNAEANSADPGTLGRHPARLFHCTAKRPALLQLQSWLQAGKQSSPAASSSSERITLLTTPPNDKQCTSTLPQGETTFNPEMKTPGKKTCAHEDLKVDTQLQRAKCNFAAQSGDRKKY